MKHYTILLLVVGSSLLLSCEDFVEVGSPNQKLVSTEVFAQEATARSALQGIYNQLYQAEFSSGWLGSVSVLAGLSADNLEPISTNEQELMEFERHSLLPDNPYNYGLWSSAYQIIYQCNALLEGVESTDQLEGALVQQLQGEASFIRAFTYFYLVNLYGEVPLVLSTDYSYNFQLPQVNQQRLYEQIISDLQMAHGNLKLTYPTGDRTRVNRTVAAGLLARVYLYQENWEQAERYSSEVIAQSGTYQLESDLDAVFLANSKESLWQLAPLSAGLGFTNTNEGSVFIINPVLPSLSYVQLSNDLLQVMEGQDLRRSHWMAYHAGIEGYYAYKYKIQYATDDASEYSMVMRLAEQYLIRAEARARQGNLSGAIADVDRIKARAAIDLLANTQPEITQKGLVEEILLERRRELFTEWGHRWLDLKRTGAAITVFADGLDDWQATDVLYPIPEEERLSNPNLGQNPGY